MKQNDLILVIDMQKAYDEGQPWACEHMSQVISNINKIVSAADNLGTRVIFTRFIADPSAEYTWQKYNEINQKVNDDPELNEIADGLKKVSAKHEIYDKSVYSALRVPQIRQAVQETNAAEGRVILTGAVDDCCVLSTFFEALDEGAYLVYVKDACAGINEEKHHSTEVVMQGLAYCHCAIMDTDACIKEK